MLPRRAERAVIDHLHQRKKSRHRRDEQDRRALQGHLRRPGDVSGEDRRGDQRIRTQQDAEGAQRKRQRLRRHAKARVAFGGSESDRGGEQPGGRKQHIAPDDPDKDKGRRQQRQQRQQQREPARAARQRECQQAKAEPVRGRDQQEHAGRAGRDRVDHAPQHGHDRGLPVAEHALADVLVDEFCVVGHDAGIEDHAASGRSPRQSARRRPRAGVAAPRCL